MQRSLSQYFKICSHSREGPNSFGRPNSEERLNRLVPSFCISTSRIWRTQTLCRLLDFNAFYMMQKYFSQSFNISSNSRRGTQFLAGNQFCRWAELLGPPYCISVLRIWRTQVLHHSLGSKAFYMMKESFSYFSKAFSNSRGRTYFLGGNQFWTTANGWINCSPCCISIFTNWRTQILCHLLDFNAIYMMQQFFSQFFNISSSSRRGIYFLSGNQFCRRAEWFDQPFCISILRIWRIQLVHHSLAFKTF